MLCIFVKLFSEEGTAVYGYILFFEDQLRCLYPVIGERDIEKMLFPWKICIVEKETFCKNFFKKNS